MSKSIGLFGGTFCPPHKGHIQAAQLFLQQVPMDELLIMPAFIPPHKTFESSVSPEQRFEMCQIAFHDLENTTISNIELLRKGKSYTADTLLELSQKYDKISMLCGTDMALTLGSWYKPDVIFSLCDIYCMRREKDLEQTSQLQLKNLEYQQRFGKSIHFLEGQPIELSSTDIRLEKSIDHLQEYLSQPVLEYILEHHLFEL